MRKRILLCAVALCVLCAFRAQQSVAAPSFVDPTLVPFKKGELQQKLEANKENAHALILLLLRADEMSSSRVDPKFNRPNSNSYNAQALRVLEQMRRRYPNNMKVLAAYCFAFDIKTQGTHHQFTNYGDWSPQKEQEVQTMLGELRKKAPKLWISYAMEGYRAFYRQGRAEQERGLKLLEKAVNLAPSVPLVRVRYGYACQLAADWQKKPLLYGVADREYQKALQLRPVSSDAALNLLYLYAYGWLPNGQPDNAKAKIVAQRFLSVLPKGYVFADYERRVLGRIGITPPR